MHSFLPDAGTDSRHIQVAGMIVQVITGARATVFRAKHTITHWNLRKGRPCSVGAELRGEEMYNFLAKMTEVVMPRIKEYKGVNGKSGDSSGDIGWALSPDSVSLFPEVEFNYDT